MGSLFWTPRRMKRCLARDFYAATRSCHARHLFARTRSGRPLLRASHFTSTCMYNTQYPIYCSLIILLSNLRTMSPQSQRLHVRAPKASHSKRAPSRLPSGFIMYQNRWSPDAYAYVPHARGNDEHRQSLPCSGRSESGLAEARFRANGKSP